MKLTKLSITIDTSINDKLPKLNKSAFINQVLKQHFLKENVDGIYTYIKSRMIKEGLLNDGSVTFESIHTGAYNPPPQDEELERYRTAYGPDGWNIKRIDGALRANKPPSRDWVSIEVLNY